MKNIAVVMGGFSAEKIISMKSGQIVADFLDKNLFNVYVVIIDNLGWRLDLNLNHILLTVPILVEVERKKYCSTVYLLLFMEYLVKTENFKAISTI